MQKEAVFVPHEFILSHPSTHKHGYAAEKAASMVLPPFFSVILFVLCVPPQSSTLPFAFCVNYFFVVKSKSQRAAATHTHKTKRHFTPTTTTVPFMPEKKCRQLNNIMWHYRFASHCLLQSLVQAPNRTGSPIITLC